jgi:hypothetical protein
MQHQKRTNGLGHLLSFPTSLALSSVRPSFSTRTMQSQSPDQGRQDVVAVPKVAHCGGGGGSGPSCQVNKIPSEISR